MGCASVEEGSGALCWSWLEIDGWEAPTRRIAEMEGRMDATSPTSRLQLLASSCDSHSSSKGTMEMTLSIRIADVDGADGDQLDHAPGESAGEEDTGGLEDIWEHTALAFTGKHRWISTDEPASYSWSSSDHADGWQIQFSAGIKTIAVVSVVPYGVVQLGSLNSIVEDLKVVSHIKHAFGLLQNPLASFPFVSMQNTRKNILNMAADSNYYLHKPDLVNNTNCDLRTHSLPSPGIYDLSQSILQMPDFQQQKAATVTNESVKIESPAVRENGSVELLRSRSGNVTSDFQKQEQWKLLNTKKSGETNSGGLEKNLGEEGKIALSSYNFCSENAILNNVGLPVDMCTVHHPCLLSVSNFASHKRTNSDGVGFLHDGPLQVLPPFDVQLKDDSENKVRFPVKERFIDDTNAPLVFPSGCELHEALGSSFKKEEEVDIWNIARLKEVEDLVEAPDGSMSGLFSESEHLLEAVVAKACSSTSNVTGESSLCKSAKSSPLATGSTQNEVKGGAGAAGGQVQTPSFLTEDDTHQSMGSVGRSAEPLVLRSSRDSMSKAPSACSGLSEKPAEPSKGNKKRAKPGESNRPRPRDRQLIQDRVKELREIVPNGSKCSIDALLERTIKHMLFLQSVTSHADKLKRCAESKYDLQLCGKGSQLLRTCSQESGTSWALEVGSQFKACPIIVENLNMNGQILVEMLCEECDLFLEIAEVIRGLGFSILKGVTESRDEKTWACFVVEGRANDSLQRMDILWSLMRLLQQPKTGV